MDEIKKIKCIVEEIESNFDVSKLEWGGINFWPIIRRQIQTDLTYKNAEQSEFVNKNSEFGIIKKYFLWLKFYYYTFLITINKYKYSIKADLLFNGYTTALYKININNKFFNQYIDPYYEFLKFSFKSEKIILNEEMKQFNKEMYYPCKIIDEKNFKKRAFLEFKLKSSTAKFKSESAALMPLIKQINNHILLNYDYLPINKTIFEQVEDILTYYSIYSKIFNASKVKIFISEGGYDNQTMGAFMACKKNNIRSIEIQHGMINGSVYAPYKSKIASEILPEYLWLWNQNDFNYITTNNISGLNFYQPINLGNLWVYRCINNEFNALSKTINFELLNKQIIVITLQPSFKLSDELCNFINNSLGYYFIVKRHPNNSQDEIESIKLKFKSISNFTLIESEEIQLIDLLKISILHITHSSASAIEALNVGVSSIIYDNYGKELFKEYIEMGLMSFCEKELEMQQFLKNMGKKRFEKIDDFDVTLNTSKIIPFFDTLLRTNLNSGEKAN